MPIALKRELRFAIVRRLKAILGTQSRFNVYATLNRTLSKLFLVVAGSTATELEELLALASLNAKFLLFTAEITVVVHVAAIVLRWCSQCHSYLVRH